MLSDITYLNLCQLITSEGKVITELRLSNMELIIGWYLKDCQDEPGRALDKYEDGIITAIEVKSQDNL